MNKFSKMLGFGVAVFALLLVYAGYIFWQNTALGNELERTKTDFNAQSTVLLEYENKKILEAVQAKEVLSDLSSGRVEWSKVITAIRKTLPKGENGDIVEVLSYSGSLGNEISMNVKTKVESDNAYLDVARLIAAFTRSANFTDPFVPSISSGVDQEGNDVLTFLLNATYVEAAQPTGITR